MSSLFVLSFWVFEYNKNIEGFEEEGQDHNFVKRVFRRFLHPLEGLDFERTFSMSHSAWGKCGRENSSTGVWSSMWMIVSKTATFGVTAAFLTEL